MTKKATLMIKSYNYLKGCPIETKASWKTEECPIKKW